MSKAYRKWLPQRKEKSKTSNEDQLYRKWIPGGKKKPETAAEDQAPLVNPPSPSQPTTSKTLGRVFRHPIVNLSAMYAIHKKLSEDCYGVIRLVKDKCWGDKFACKSITLDQMGQARLPDLIRSEVEILHHLTGHPNIVDLKQVVEDEKAVHLIMELGKGGTLSKRRRLFFPPTKKQSTLKKHFKSKPYPEEEAKEMFRHIATALRDCHGLGVIHRDLKPDNLVFATKKKGSPLILINFGLSVFYIPGEKFEEMIGSPPYVAPEVVNPEQLYGPKADIWSAGVILHTILSGVLPFWAATADKLPEAIRQSNYKDYDTESWDKISNNAKHLLRSMLTEDQEARISAHDILNHPWLREASVPYAPREIPIMRRIEEFHAMSKFRRVAMKVIATTLLVEEAGGLIRLLKSFKDAEIANGIAFKQGLSYSELKAGLYKLGVDLPEHEVNHLVNSVDVDSDWIIDQSEFIAATMHPNVILRHGRQFKAFQYFDRNNDGRITTEDMKQALRNCKITELRINMIIEEVYSGQEIGILYNEFIDVVRWGETLRLNHDQLRTIA